MMAVVVVVKVVVMVSLYYCGEITVVGRMHEGNVMGL